jgi:hypothetical protein
MYSTISCGILEVTPTNYVLYVCCHFVNCDFVVLIVGNYVSLMFANSISVGPRVRLFVCLYVV